MRPRARTRFARQVMLGVALGTAALPLGAQDAVEVGAVGASNEAMLGTPPAEARRELQVGTRVQLRERIETSEIGAGQILFNDQSTLSVWPNSDLVLDEYFYDPDQSVGKIGLTMTEGVLRFIGGQISKTADVTITTPHAVVAVRGGIAMVSVTPGGTEVVHVAGEYTRLNDLTLSRPNASGAARPAEGPAAGTPGGGGAVVTTYTGIADAETVAELYGRPMGQGDGGAPQLAEGEQIEAALAQSGLTEAGFSAVDAASLPPVSTTGEQSEEDEADGTGLPGDAPGLSERADTLIADLTGSAEDPSPDDGGPDDPGGPDGPDPDDPDPDDPDPDDPDPDDPDPDDPDDPDPDDPDPPAALPFSGGRYASSEEDAGAPALSRIVALPGGPVVFVEFLDIEGTPDAVRAETPDGAVFDTPDLSTGGQVETTFGTFGGRPARIERFVDVGQFYLVAVQTNDDQPLALSLNIFGRPTPDAVWQAPSVATLGVRHYSLTDPLFDGGEGTLPLELGGPFATPVAATLTLVPEPGAPIVQQVPGALGFENDTGQSKWLLAVLDIEGEGEDQVSAFGSYTSRVLASRSGGDGAPTSNGTTRLTARLDAYGGTGFGTQPVGTLDGGDGTTAYGPNGDYLVIGGGAAFLTRDSDPDIDTQAARYSERGDGGETVVTYGDTRLAVLDGIEDLALDGRLSGALARAGLPADSALGDVPLGATADGRLTHFLTGGYAVAHGESAQGSGAAQVTADPYLVLSDRPQDVRFGFDADTNAAVGEIRMQAVDAGADIDDIRLAFGGVDETSALLTDESFVVTETRGTAGGLSGTSISVSGRTGSAAAGGVQTAFAGGLATATITGDGGIFPSNVDTTPEHLSWGWWGGQFKFGDTPGNATYDDREERFHLGAWVSGVVSTVAEVNALTGTATYGGLAVASVSETTASGVAAYVDGGRFQMNYNFGARTGTASIDGIAGQSVTAAVTPPGTADGNHFQGALTGFDTGSGSGALRGAFFKGDGDPRAATAGSFDFQAATAGGSVKAAGIFAADRVD